MPSPYLWFHGTPAQTCERVRPPAEEETWRLALFGFLNRSHSFTSVCETQNSGEKRTSNYRTAEEVGHQNSYVFKRWGFAYRPSSRRPD